MLRLLAISPLLLAACAVQGPAAVAARVATEGDTLHLPDTDAAFTAAGADLTWLDAALHVETTAWGRDGAVRPLDRVAPDVAQGRGAWSHDGIQEWWVRDGSALEHGYTLGALDGEGLIRIEVAFDADRLTVDGDGAGASLLIGDKTVRYAGLVALDANGEALPAWMEPTPSGLAILVDDTDAAWPITVDPLVYSPFLSGYLIGINHSRGVGDLNADGYDDAVVYDGYGKANLHYGSASGLSTTADLTLDPTLSTTYGYSDFLDAGDINGDGLDDMVVTNPEGASTHGIVLTWFGRSGGILPTPDRFLSPPFTSYLGGQPSALGDVNGDGYDDISVTTGSYIDPIYLYYGSPHGLNRFHSQLLVPSLHYSAVSGVGDVNGDGYADMAVGVVNATPNGAVLVYFGGPTGMGTTEHRIDWPASAHHGLTNSACFSDTQFGSSPRSMGDLNGDGYGEMVVGAPTEYCNMGFAYIFYGSASGPVATSWSEFFGAAGGANEYLGANLDMGDFNGDGLTDFISDGQAPMIHEQPTTGFPVASDTSPYLLYPTLFATLPVGASSFYFDVLGDVNGDGCDDVFINVNGGFSDDLQLYYGSGSGC